MRASLFSGIFVNEYTLDSVIAEVEVDFTRSQLISGLPAAAFCLWYVLKKHWLANNTLGLAFSIQVCTHSHIEMPTLVSREQVGFGYIDDVDDTTLMTLILKNRENKNTKQQRS